MIITGRTLLVDILISCRNIYVKWLWILLYGDLLFFCKHDFRSTTVAPESSKGFAAAAFNGTCQRRVLRPSDGEKDEGLALMALLQIAVMQNLSDFGLNSILVLGNG